MVVVPATLPGQQVQGFKQKGRLFHAQEGQGGRPGKSLEPVAAITVKAIA
jgi:hypothetical protein